MPPLPPPNEEEYDSTADADFDASLSASSADESEASDAEAITKSKKRKTDADGDVEMDSGDEGIVAQGRKKKRKVKEKGKGKGGEEEMDGEDGDEDEPVGVRVRLRSGRGGEDPQNKPFQSTTGATINDDSVWARLNKPSARKPTTSSQNPPEITTDAENNPPPSSEPTVPATSNPDTTITIPHTYTFAGETHTSTKTVPASSPEALAYLASKNKDTLTSTGPTLRRPLARKNLLDPNPTLLIKGRQLPPRADLPTSIGGKGTRSLGSGMKASQWAVSGKGEKAKKLNTVEKSKLDWEAEVERQGMREELERAEKSGASYLGRMEFLGRVEGKEEEEARAARERLREKTG